MVSSNFWYLAEFLLVSAWSFLSPSLVVLAAVVEAVDTYAFACLQPSDNSIAFSSSAFQRK